MQFICLFSENSHAKSHLIMAYLPKSARGKTKFLGVGEKAISCYTQTKNILAFIFSRTGKNDQ